MVAYSFKAQFAPSIVDGSKLQTVRGNRKRHALPGEAIQLYTAMRTKHCRKLLDVDPICLDVRPIVIETKNFEHSSVLCPLINRIEIEGECLDRDEINAFAFFDGFRPEIGDSVSPHRLMAAFWHRHHGFGVFEGVVIRWRPA